MNRLIPLSIVLLPTLLQADALTLGPTELKDITITRVDAGRIYYKPAGGTETSKELSSVTRLALNDEPALTTAETATATNNLDAAAENYLRALRGTQKPWLRTYIAPRLASAAAKARRFDIAVAAHTFLLTTDPAAATSTKPSLTPAPKAGELTATIDTVQASLAKNPASVPLLQFLADLQSAQGDNVGALNTLTKAAALDSSLAPATATARLAAASAAISKGDASAAITLLNEAPAAFTTPATQVEALYLLAYAKESQARSLRSEPALQDAAIAYIRLAAHFRQDLNATARVEAALLRAAVLLEDLRQPGEARALWRELSSSKDPAISGPARQGLARTSG